jgi:hypothetical protein
MLILLLFILIILALGGFHLAGGIGLGGVLILALIFFLVFRSRL